MNNTVFDFPHRFPDWLLMYPTFNITRLIYTLAHKCGYEKCISKVSHISEEMVTCLIFLYTTPLIFIVLGIYLYEVLPQKFGVTKHPLFCLMAVCKRRKQRKISIDHIELPSDDSGVLGQAKLIEIMDDRSDYPLVAEGLTKVTFT
jgi:hypothetical protein